MKTKRGNIDYIFICSQMHGFILKDKSDNFISNFISWKDERSAIFFRQSIQKTLLICSETLIKFSGY